MKVKIIYTENSPYNLKEENIECTEVHYCFESVMIEEIGQQTAFENFRAGTGFTIPNKYIKEFEIKD